MKLAFKERLVFNVLYPTKGNLMEQILVQDINKKINFSQDELKAVNYRVEGNMVLWDGNPNEVDIFFSNAEIQFLKTRVDELDKNKEITQDILSLCKKIKEI